MTDKPSNTKFYSQIVDLLQSARNQVLQTVNRTMVLTYFEIGRILVEEEQNGNERAEYGKELIKGVSEKLTKEFGKGFSSTNLKQMRSFYLVYGIGQTPSDLSQLKSFQLQQSIEKRQTVSDQFNKVQVPSQNKFILSWSHYLKLMRIDNENERKFYEIECQKK